MIDKIELREKHIYCTSKIKKSSSQVLIMSHGSGGISDVDLDFASIACNNGFDVAIIDHFTSRDVEVQSWKDLVIKPTFEERENDIIYLQKKYKASKVFGISAGGTAAIATSKFFNSCLAVYPALACVNENMLQASNVSVITGVHDNWCPIEHARRYSKYSGCNLYELEAEHGYLNPRQDRFMADVYSLRKIDLPIPTSLTYNKLDYKEKGVTLRYCNNARTKTEDLFYTWINL